MWLRGVAASLLALVVMTGCGAEQAGPAAGATADGAIASASAPESVAAHPAVVKLLSDLQSRGIEPEQTGASQIQWLRAVPGHAYRLGEERLYLHPYPSVEAAQATAAQIPPTADTGLTDWVDTPHFFLCNTVIALYLGKDSDVLNGLTEVCGPQFAGRA